MPSPILTKDRTLIAWSKCPGDWDTSSDPQASRTVDSFRRSADRPQEKAGGRLAYDDVTITRVWDEARDSAILRQFKKDPDWFNDGILSLTSLGIDGVPMGTPDTYVGIVQSMSRTGADANDGAKSMLSVVLSISSGA